jgi:replicative DNA helicase
MIPALRENSPAPGAYGFGETPPARVPPHNFEMEMGLLAAMLANNRAHETVADFLRPVHFADARHGRIYAAIDKLAQRGEQANAFTLKNYFEQDGDLDDIGGVAYLGRLQAAAVTIVNTADYARRIFDLWQRRELIDMAARIADSAYSFDLDKDAGKVIEGAEQALFELSEHAASPDEVVSLNEAGIMMLEAYAAAHRNGGRVGTPTGFAKIDDMLGGLEAGSLTICGARPSMGKTALAVGMAERMARAGDGVLFFQLEMSAPQIARRMAASATGLDVSEIKRTRLDDAAFRRMVETLRELENLPIHIVDRPGITAAQIRSIARRHKRKHGLKVLIVDHLTLMGWPADARGQSPTWAIGQNSGALKRLAKELGIAVLCLCQLSRANEGRENVRPQLSDLRWSGEIEQDADTVFFVHREAYYLERGKPSRKSGETSEELAKRLSAWEEALEQAKGRAEIVVAKQRDGAVGLVQIGFESATTRFHDLDEAPPYVESAQGFLLEGPA